jgi:hypothetical protein
MSSTPPAAIKITPRAIHRQEPAAKGEPDLPPPVSAGVCTGTGLDWAGSGTPVSSGGTLAVTAGVTVGDSGAGVDSTVGDFVAAGGVWLPAVGEDVGVRVAVAEPVAVAAPKVGPPVGVCAATELVAVGVSDGTAGGSVGVWVGGGTAGLVAVGALVAPVGVAVGTVWFSLPASAIPFTGAPQAASRIASVTTTAKTTTRRLIAPSLMPSFPPHGQGISPNAQPTR